MPRFILVQSGQESEINLPDGEHLVGRSSKCAITIKDVAASREHCRIVVNGDRVHLVDSGSRNGTLLNGRRAGSEQLKLGDVIRIGDTYIHIGQKREQAQAPAARPSTTAAPRGHRLVKDYQIWATGSMEKVAYLGRRVLTIGLLLALAGVVAAVVFMVASNTGKKRTQSSNLIRTNPSFAASGSSISGAWRPVGEGVRVALDKTVERSPGGSMVVDKTTPESAMTLEYHEDFDAIGRRRVDVRIWARAQDFEGSAALRVRWYDRNERLLLEDYSPLIEVGADWKMLSGGFQPPPSAGVFKIAVVAVGSQGRLNLDDAEVENRTHSDQAKPQVVMDYGVISAQRTANQMILWKNREVAANVHLEVKPGQKWVSLVATQPLIAAREQADRLAIDGEVLWPFGLAPVIFSQTVMYDAGELFTSYDVESGSGRQAGEIRLIVDLVRASPIETTSAYVRNIAFNIGNNEFEIEYSQPVKIEAQTLPGGVRLIQTYEVTGETTSLAWRLRETSTTAELQIKKFKSDLGRVRDNRPGLKRSILRRLIAQLRDPDEISTYMTQLQKLNQRETSRWDQVRLQAKIAVISGRSEKASVALRSIQEFLAEFEDTSLTTEVEDLTRDLMGITTAGGEGDPGVARRLMEAAEKHLHSGKDDLAKGILEVVAEGWEGTDIGSEARQRLEKLGE